MSMKLKLYDRQTDRPTDGRAHRKVLIPKSGHIPKLQSYYLYIIYYIHIILYDHNDV